jgi:DNA-binding transcriptional LysR family regulator
MFDLKQLRCFVTLAGERHFGRAALEMNMTQSPFRRQIRLLEEELGVQLLDRDSRQVELTRPGRAFLIDARHILCATDTVAMVARETAAGVRGNIMLGFTTTAGFSLMPQIVTLCRTHLPNVALALREMSSQEQTAQLKAGGLDIGLIWKGGGPGLSDMPLAVEPLVAALPPRDTRLRKPSLSPRDFHGRAFVMYAPDSAAYLHGIVSRMLDSENCAPHFVQHLPNAHAMLSMVGSGMGAAVVPQSATSLNLEGVKFSPLRCAVRCEAEIHAVWHSDNPNPALARFVQLIGSLSRPQGWGSTAPAIEQGKIDPAVAIARRKMNGVSLVE